MSANQRVIVRDVIDNPLACECQCTVQWKRIPEQLALARPTSAPSVVMDRLSGGFVLAS